MSTIIVALLICVTVGFEKIHNYLLTTTKRSHIVILHAVYGELTVLGFLALILFGLMRTGVLTYLSVVTFGNEHHLVNLFELVHFLVFFVMISFLCMAMLLLTASDRCCDMWHSFQIDIGLHGAEHISSTLSLLQQALDQERQHSWLALLSSRYNRLWAWQEEHTDKLRYWLIRQRFIDAGLSNRQHGRHHIPVDFDMAKYLNLMCGKKVAEMVQLQPMSWGVVTLWVVLGLQITAFSGHEDYVIITWGWALFIMCLVINGKLEAALTMLTTLHPQSAPYFSWSIYDLAMSPLYSYFHSMYMRQLDAAMMLKLGDKPPYLSMPHRKSCSKHLSLLWGGKDGPEFLVGLMRQLLLLCAIFVAHLAFLLLQGLPVLSVAFAAFPIVIIMVEAPPRLLPALVLVTGIEQQKDWELINRDLLSLKVEKAMSVMHLMHSIHVQVKREHASSRDPDLPPSRSQRRLEKASSKILSDEDTYRLHEAWRTFDKTDNGQIKTSELSQLVQSLGMSASTEEVTKMIQLMDTQQSGTVEFAQFCTVMKMGPSTELDPSTLAEEVFETLDKDHNGYIVLHSLAQTLLKISGELSSEDCADIVAMFDLDGDGMITQKEFASKLADLQAMANGSLDHSTGPPLPGAGRSQGPAQQLLESVSA